jgi:hypothetical protein
LTQRKLIQSIIKRKGNCSHVNCDGGSYIPEKFGREILEPLEDFSNLGVPCPLYDQCSNDSDQKDVLLMAKVYMKKLKKEKKKDD